MNAIGRGLAWVAWLAAAPVALAAQGAAPPATQPRVVATGKIEIVTIEPAKGTVLKAGGTATFKARVRYQRTAGSAARIQLLVQDQAHKPLLPKPPSVTVDKAEGEVDLQAEVVIPKTGVTAVDVFIPMFSADPGVKGTSTATFVKYTVAP
jgi:hypothetical protein